MSLERSVSRASILILKIDFEPVCARHSPLKLRQEIATNKRIAVLTRGLIGKSVVASKSVLGIEYPQVVKVRKPS